MLLQMTRFYSFLRRSNVPLFVTDIIRTVIHTYCIYIIHTHIYAHTHVCTCHICILPSNRHPGWFLVLTILTVAYGEVIFSDRLPTLQARNTRKREFKAPSYSAGTQAARVRGESYASSTCAALHGTQQFLLITFCILAKGEKPKTKAKCELCP